MSTRENGEKHILGLIYATWAQILATIFFFNLDLPVTRYYGQLPFRTISEKTNDPILRKFSDGRTDKRMDAIDFIGRCPTNIERPKVKQKQKLINSLARRSKQKYKCKQATSANFIKLVSVVRSSLLKYLFLLLNGKYITI